MISMMVELMDDIWYKTKTYFGLAKMSFRPRLMVVVCLSVMSVETFEITLRQRVLGRKNRRYTWVVFYSGSMFDRFSPLSISFLSL